MDQLELAEFAKVSENKEDPSTFTDAVQEQGIAQGSLIVSRLYNTMLGSITRVMKSWNTELVNVLDAAGINPSALTDEQLLAAILQLIKQNSNGLQLGDLIPNIGTVSPVGRALCNGQRLTNCQTMFPDFYTYVTTKTPYKTVSEWNAQVSVYGQCGFCAVDGADVILPLITRPISGVSNISQTGQAINDTMRPIKGDVGGFNTWIAQGGVTSGAFYNKNDIRGGDVRGGGGRDYSYQGSMDSGRLGTAYNGSETRGKQVQYPYYIQIYTAPSSQALVNTAELVDMLKYQNQVGIIKLTQTSGNISLASGGIYTLTLSGNTTFVLPTPEDKTLLNQILVQLNITAASITINWGTTNYFSGQPSTSLGNSNIIFEYDALMNSWVVGQVEKISL